jgi:hypothetical protein
MDLAFINHTNLSINHTNLDTSAAETEVKKQADHVNFHKDMNGDGKFMAELHDLQNFLAAQDSLRLA